MFNPIYNYIYKVITHLVKKKLLILPTPPSKDPKFSAIDQYEYFYNYHGQIEHLKKDYHQLKNKIQHLVNIGKISFPYPKVPMLKNDGPQHKQNRNLGIYKNPFLKLVRAKDPIKSIKFLEGY